MQRPGHYGMSLFVYAPLGAVVLALGFDELALLGGAVTVGGAMLPDLDERVSFVQHRGPTHTVWFALAVGAVLGLVGAAIGVRRSSDTAVALGAFGALVGVLTVVAHLLADALTPAGIRPFAPLRETRYALAITGAGYPLANYLLLAAGVAAAIGAVLVGRVIAGGG